MKKTILSLLTIATFAWFSSYRVEKVPEIADELVAKAEVRDIHVDLQLTGDITPSLQVEIKPEVSGKIKQLHVKVGQRVAKGDVVAEVNDAELQTERAGVLTEIEGAQLRVEKSRRNYERARELFKTALITEEVFDNLESDCKISENELTKSQRRLRAVDEKISKTKILAPADGTILSLNVIEGQVVVAAASVNSGTTVMMLADLAKLRIDSHVNQEEIDAIRLKQKLHFQCRALGDDASTAIVTFISPVASVKNGIKGFKVQALIEQPISGLRPGQTVSMRIPVSKVNDCVTVPLSGVFQDFGAASFVVYVRKGDMTEERRVRVGVSDLFFTQITTGLEAGEEILLVRPKS